MTTKKHTDNLPERVDGKFKYNVTIREHGSDRFTKSLTGGIDEVADAMVQTLRRYVLFGRGLSNPEAYREMHDAFTVFYDSYTPPKIKGDGWMNRYRQFNGYDVAEFMAAEKDAEEFGDDGGPDYFDKRAQIHREIEERICAPYTAEDLENAATHYRVAWEVARDKAEADVTKWKDENDLARRKNYADVARQYFAKISKQHVTWLEKRRGAEPEICQVGDSPAFAPLAI